MIFGFMMNDNNEKPNMNKNHEQADDSDNDSSDDDSTIYVA